jgi:hypothetical protein
MLLRMARRLQLQRRCKMEAGRDRAMSSGSRGMLEAFVGRGRLDGRGFRVREEAALGDEHPRQAAAKVEWARARGVWWERV